MIIRIESHVGATGVDSRKAATLSELQARMGPAVTGDGALVNADFAPALTKESISAH
jgi:hypothetical protein